MKKGVKIGAAVLVLLTILSIVMYIYVYDTVYDSYTVEAGEIVEASCFGKYYKNDTEFVGGIAWIDMTIPGSYEVQVKNTIFTHNCELIVVDRVPPTATGVDIDWPVLNELTPEVCVLDVVDVTNLTYEFVGEVDYTNYVKQEITIRITDLGENSIDVVSYVRFIPMVESIIIEVGEEVPDYRQFLVDEDLESTCLTDLESIDTLKPQSVMVEVEINGQVMSSQLEIVDTVAPTADNVAQTGYFTSSEFTVYDFVENIQDITEVTATLETTIDYNSSTMQNVLVLLEDEGGNITEVESTLLLKADTTGPVITCADGSIRSLIGDSIAYKQSVTATDNCDESVTVTFDNSDVDINTLGTYSLACSATDKAGNTTTETFEVVIYKELTMAEKVDEMVEVVLADIINDSMSQYDKAYAIYWYCRNNIAYVGTSDKSSYLQGAYDGLKYLKGDCFTYAATAKYLLTAAGITNMDIVKIPSSSSHYWNLVDLGNGWIHFDAVRRSDGTVIFLWTDAELMEYSNSHNLSHNYDTSAYPVIN